MEYSKLFWPVEYKKNLIYVLDETLLPEKVRYIRVRNLDQGVEAIRQMKTRAVGQVILVFYIFLQIIQGNKKKAELLPVLRSAASRINASRPTLSFKFLTDMVLDWAQKGAPLETCITAFLDTLKDKRIQQAKKVSALLDDGDVILTHCNISGLLVLIADICKEQYKKISFFVTETRPYLQGSRLTAWELTEAGFDTTVIADNMAAQVMAEGKIKKIIVGADHLAQNGDIANKIGTLQIAILARYFHIPFYVICPPPSQAKTGKDIQIEIRPEKELLEFAGRRIAPKKARGYYPAFDVTPNEMISQHIYLEISR